MSPAQSFPPDPKFPLHPIDETRPVSTGALVAREAGRAPVDLWIVNEPWRRAYVFDEVDSTQALARRLVGCGVDLHGIALIASAQTHGQGRQGRLWNSRPGGLYLTLGLPALAPADAALTGWWPLIAALALVDSLPGNAAASIFIKWPNDLVVDTPEAALPRKLAGLLGDAWPASPRQPHLWLVGCGINWSNAVEGILPPAITLAELGVDDSPGARHEFIGRVLVHLARRIAALAGTRAAAFAALHAAVEARLWRRGQPVRLAHTEHGAVEGRLLGLDAHAGARLELPDGTELIAHAGATDAHGLS